MARPYWKFLLLLLCLPTLVRADLAGAPLPLRLDRGPLPFDCASCHPQMAKRLEGSPHAAQIAGSAAPESIEVRCYVCHVDAHRACRFATVRDEQPEYLHNLKIAWPAEGRYQLRLRSRNTRADSVCPAEGALVFDTRRPQAAAAPQIDSPEDNPGRLRISRVSLHKVEGEASGVVKWETNLRADSEAIFWPADTREHLPLKDEQGTGTQCCRDCHPPDVWVVSHPVGVRLPPAMQGCRLPLGPGNEIICATCHDPHGSREAYLLRKDQDQLCRSCHQGY